MRGCAVKHCWVRKVERGGKRGKGILRERNKAFLSVHLYVLGRPCTEECRYISHLYVFVAFLT